MQGDIAAADFIERGGEPVEEFGESDRRAVEVVAQIVFDAAHDIARRPPFRMAGFLRGLQNAVAQPRGLIRAEYGVADAQWRKVLWERNQG